MWFEYSFKGGYSAIDELGYTQMVRDHGGSCSSIAPAQVSKDDINKKIHNYVCSLLMSGGAATFQLSENDKFDPFLSHWQMQNMSLRIIITTEQHR